MSLARDIGKYITAANALDAAVITAAAGNDGVEVNGNSIDRLEAGRELALSATLFIAYKATLDENETLTLTANMQDAAVSNFASGAADLTEVLAATVVATGDTGGSTERGVARIDLDLSSARQYVRAQVTANLSRAGTDTVALSAVLVFGGAAQLPAT